MNGDAIPKNTFSVGDVVEVPIVTIGDSAFPSYTWLPKCYNLSRRGAVVKGVEYFDTFVTRHLSGAGSSPAGSVGRDLNLQKLNYQYLTTSVAVVLVAR